MALILPFTDTTCDRVLPDVRQVLDAHGVLALPTETYYGLAVRPTDETALRRLIELKGGHPISRFSCLSEAWTNCLSWSRRLLPPQPS